MGESIVDLQKDAHKMGETNASNSVLEVSVSFGRFENDSLSWEKWSAFSPNKYLEEVGKCATPGSVAKKKAYFEAHYKKIAARKAELLEQEKEMQHDLGRSDDQSGGDLNTFGNGAETDISKDQTFAEEVKQETNLLDEMSETHLDDLKDDDLITIECQSSSVEIEKEELDSKLSSPNTSKPEDAVVVKKMETISNGSQGIKEAPQDLDSGIVCDSKIKEKKVKLDYPNPKESRKANPMNKEGNMARVKKSPVTPLTKTPKNSTVVSKSTPNSSRVYALKSSANRVDNGATPRNKNPSDGETKKVAPKSLHMSLGMGPTNSYSSSPTTARKSFIMEKMGDKDIVKRAFKSFQNNFSQLKSSSEERSALHDQGQVSTKETKLRVSASITPKKENGRSLKTGGLDKRNAKTPSSFGLKSDERAEKRKVKIEEKSNAKEAERTRLQSKSKEEEEAEIKKLRQSLKFKATPMPGFYRGQKVSKSSIDKVKGSRTIRFMNTARKRSVSYSSICKSV
ncbi:protein WVD2-like 7 isoform X2 [Ziziphus jujuba]|uniref:Protein WVD2-like 7 isoform X2 n=1 Tax=Ziziphus jujuba TaxID=326968 RepID=A0ABM3ZYB6_ZIZJJ|nr:protein WVD2-like 7 isoform X2 [Ziziphus jujuba]